jgi:hypothetical protein
MEGFRRLVDLVRFRGQIAYSVACEQHFNQESAERAHGDQQGEPKGYKQGNPGPISRLFESGQPLVLNQGNS